MELSIFLSCVVFSSSDEQFPGIEMHESAAISYERLKQNYTIRYGKTQSENGGKKIETEGKRKLK